MIRKSPSPLISGTAGASVKPEPTCQGRRRASLPISSQGVTFHSRATNVAAPGDGYGCGPVIKPEGLGFKRQRAKAQPWRLAVQLEIISARVGRNRAYVGEVLAVGALLTGFSSPVTSPDRMNDQEAERRRPAALGFHTRRTNGAPLPTMRARAMGIPPTVRNHTPSMPWHAGTSATKMRASPVPGTIAVASGCYLGNIGARRRFGHRGHSLAPAHARKAVARTAALLDERVPSE